MHKLHRSEKYILWFIAICGFVSLLPFLLFEVYEFAYPYNWIIQNLFIHIFIFSCIGSILYYKKVYKKDSMKKHSRIKPIFYQFLLTGIFAVGITFFTTNSAILYNAQIGKSELINLSTPVIETHISKSHGGIRYHYIQIYHPLEHRILELNTDQAYQINDSYETQIYIGSLGLIYKNK